MVTYNWASMPDAFHGIAFEGNHEVAQFQVRFFGLLAYISPSRASSQRREARLIAVPDAV